MSFSIRALLLSGLACSLAFSYGPASAQSIPSPYRFIERGQSVELLGSYVNTDQGQFEFGPRSGIAVGARYGVEISGPLGLDLVASVMPTDRNVVNPARDEGDRVVGIAESTLVFLEGRLRFALTGRRTWHSIQPYVYLGAGLGFDIQGAQREDQLLVEADRFEFGTKFSANGGLGARIFLSDRWFARVEPGFRIYQLSTPQGFRDPARELGNVGESEWTTGTSITVGLSWLF